MEPNEHPPAVDHQTPLESKLTELAEGRAPARVRSEAPIEDLESPTPTQIGGPIHVQPVDGGHWEARIDGDGAPLLSGRTKAETLDAAREAAREHGCSVVIHRMDGSVQDTVTPA